MKRKFYDDPPELDDVYHYSYWADPKHYWNEINYIAKKEGKNVNSFQIDDMTFGEPVLFVDGKYWGYLDHYFYLELEHGISCWEDDEYWDRYENYKNNS